MYDCPQIFFACRHYRRASISKFSSISQPYPKITCLFSSSSYPGLHQATNEPSVTGKLDPNIPVATFTNMD